MNHTVKQAERYLTIFDLRCDRCDLELVGPAVGDDQKGDRRGVRFLYHPGDPALSDNSSIVCSGCWSDIASWLGTQPSDSRCSACHDSLTANLVIQSGSATWRLCTSDAVDFLNSLRTVAPKLDRETFVLPSQPSES